MDNVDNNEKEFIETEKELREKYLHKWIYLQDKYAFGIDKNSNLRQSCSEYEFAGFVNTIAIQLVSEEHPFVFIEYTGKTERRLMLIPLCSAKRIICADTEEELYAMKDLIEEVGDD